MKLTPISKEEALEEHERLHRLFRENRFCFELERKQAIETTIANARTRHGRERLQKTQDRVDHVLKNAGSVHNRLVLMQMMFWDHVTKPFFPAWGPGKQNK